MQCFKCERLLENCFESEIGTLKSPNGGVHFTGGWNYGSTLYDALNDGIHVELVVCDECLKTNKNLIMEMRKVEKVIQESPLMRLVQTGVERV